MPHLCLQALRLETVQVMALAADEHSWGSRNAALFFSGANLGFQRRNLSFTDWNLHREVRISLRGCDKEQDVVMGSCSRGCSLAAELLLGQHCCMTGHLDG